MRRCWKLSLKLVYDETWVVVFVLFTASTFFSFVEKANAAKPCDLPLAQVVSVQGNVELRRGEQTFWQPATMNTKLCPGDSLRVRKRSRAALRLSNESMLRLDQKSFITFPETEADQGTSLLDFFSGALHIITRTPKPFKIRTPFVNAAVEGTEFFIGLDEKVNKTRIVLYEGQVSVRNAQGSLLLVDQEAAVVYQGQPPQREILVHPIDAVQWALYYPAVIGYSRDNDIQDKTESSQQLGSAEHLLSIGRVDVSISIENLPVFLKKEHLDLPV